MLSSYVGDEVVELFICLSVYLMRGARCRLQGVLLVQDSCASMGSVRWWQMNRL